MLGGNLGSLLYGDVSVMISPLAIKSGPRITNLKIVQSSYEIPMMHGIVLYMAYIITDVLLKYN